MKKNYIKQMFALLLLAIFTGQANAQEVNFDFNSSGVDTSSSDSHDGDITEDYSISQDGVTLTISPKTSGNNNNRFWNSDDGPQLRCYSGTITISASQNIASVEFNVYKSYFNLTPNVGGLSGTIWGGKATEIIFTVNGNTQLNAITVRLGDDGQEPEAINVGTADNPITTTRAMEIIAGGNIPTTAAYVSGKIASIKEVSLDYGNATFWITDDGSAATTETDMLQLYHVTYLNKQDFTEDNLNVGDDVIVCGKLQNYKGNTPEIGNDGYIYSHNGNTGSTTPVDPQPVDVTTLDGFVNGDFEAWTEGLPDHWNSGNNVSNATLEQSTDSHGGSYAVSIKAKSSNTRLAYEPMNLEAGTYQISFYAKGASDDAIARPGYADEKEDGSLNYNYLIDQVTVNPNEWKNITCEFTLEEAKTVYLMVMCNKNSTGDLLIDDYTIGKKDGGDTPEPVNIPVAGNIERLKTMEANQEVKLMLEDALVLYVSGKKEMFVRDASNSAMCFYNMNDYFKVGDVLNGSITARFTVYKGMPELTAQNSDNFSIEDVAITANNTPQPKEMTLDEINAYECDYVVVNNMMFTKNDDGSVIGYTDDAEATIYDKFEIGYSFEENVAYNVKGIVIPYQQNNEAELIYQFCPTEEFSGIVKQKATFRKTDDIEAGKQYLLVAKYETEDGATKTVIGKPITGNYGYINVEEVEDNNGVIRAMEDMAYTINASATSGSDFTIMQSDGRYLYQKGTYNSFNVSATPEEGQFWQFDPQNGGYECVVFNTSVEKYIQFSITHNSFGSYSAEQENAVLPMLYVMSDDESTAISEISAAKAEGAIYNMAGQRVAGAQKGIYIQGGKKYVVK